MKTVLLPIVALALVAACTDPNRSDVADAGPPPEPLPFEPAGPSAAPDPSVMGPFPVGVRTVTFLDTSRTTVGREGPRKLLCEIWYPAVEAARNGPPARYVLHDVLPDEMKSQLDAAALGSVETAAVRDAAPRKDRGAFPLVVFSHGKGGIRMQSTYFTVHLASHGYVVIAPDHEGDTLPDQLREGDFNPTTTVDSYIERPIDIMFILDELARLPADDVLAGTIDLTRVGMSGHSFGALTSMRVAGMDGRIDAVVAHTPAGYTVVQADIGIPLEQYGIPMLIEAGDMDRTLPLDPHATSNWEHMRAPRFFLRMATAGHFTWSDLCILDVAAIDAALDIDASNVLEDGCGPQNIAPERAFPVIRHYSIGFFNQYLRGSTGTGALLDEAHAQALGAEGVTFIAEP